MADIRKQTEELQLMMEKMEEQDNTLTQAYREELDQWMEVGTFNIKLHTYYIFAQFLLMAGLVFVECSERGKKHTYRSDVGMGSVYEEAFGNRGQKISTLVCTTFAFYLFSDHVAFICF